MGRFVNMATCSVDFDREEGSPPEVYRRRALDLVDEAGRQGADIVCLPEFCATDWKDGIYVPVPVPGPVPDAFAALARRHRMYVLVPLVEENGTPRGYNTTLVLDRQGQVVGQYRKTHLCMPGFQEGEILRAGDEVPVFPLDFGVIGIAVCMDMHYPELFMAMALKGAEVIFWPTGAIDYTGDLIESLVNARAVDNQVYFVASHYVQQPYLAGKMYGRSRIVDPMGRIRADTGHFPGVACARIDLDQTYPTFYTGKMKETYPTMRETVFKTRRPELYGDLIEPVCERHWKRT